MLIFEKLALHFYLSTRSYRINFWLELMKCPFQVLTGNVDTTSHSKSLLDPPIHTRVVRIVPHSQQPRIVCLRFELFGCPNVVDAKDRYGHQRFHLLNAFFGKPAFQSSLGKLVFQVWSLTQFYSVDFSQSRIGVSKCVFYKRTIKVCVSCC